MARTHSSPVFETAFVCYLHSTPNHSSDSRRTKRGVYVGGQYVSWKAQLRASICRRTANLRNCPRSVERVRQPHQSYLSEQPRWHDRYSFDSRSFAHSSSHLVLHGLLRGAKNGCPDLFADLCNDSAYRPQRESMDEGQTTKTLTKLAPIDPIAPLG